jgi:hypothetical protein
MDALYWDTMDKQPCITIEEALHRWSEGEFIKDLVKLTGMSVFTFYKRIQETPELTNAHARARLTKAEISVDELLKIADEEIDPQRARNRIDARKWVAAKYNAQVYGDRLDLNVNQTVDIGAALAEARARLSPRNTASPVNENSIEIPMRDVTNDTGLSPDPHENSSTDIFD